MRIFRARGMQEHYIVHDPCISLSLSLSLSLYFCVPTYTWRRKSGALLRASEEKKRKSITKGATRFRFSFP